ncbi:DUF2513 domain-containing protein [Weissella minor]|uniref:DUF2513 domain-containing protein n=1 Tax=Weissella minor TaxID=1620 RepID=UPI003AF20389
MRLNHDLVRELLIAIGNSSDPVGLSQNESNKFIKDKNISVDEYAFMVTKLSEAGFITGRVEYGSNQPVRYAAGNLTYAGNEYLDNIEDAETWSNVKAGASKVGNVSLSIMSELAISYLKTKLGI